MNGCSLGPWHVGERLGSGGSGDVYAAVHPTQGVRVAVKVVTAARARDALFLEAFAREVRAVARLQHPGVVTVLDLGVVDEAAAEASGGALAHGAPYLAMECADGSLRRQGRPNRWSELQDQLVQLLHALAHAHGAGVIHRDIKPGNVLVRDGRMLLADFGLAHANERAEPALLGTAGTPTFMAPEQFLGDWRRFGPWTDLYALGGLAWALATGLPAHRSRSVDQLRRAHLAGELPPFAPRFDTPIALEGWLRRLLLPEPLDRFRRAADALDALLQLDPTLATSTRTSEPAQAASATLTRSILVEPGTPQDLPALDTFGMPRRRVPPLPSASTLPRSESPSIQLVGAGLGLYGLREVPMVGRTEAAAEIWHALARARQREGLQIVVIRGAAGTGKTRLASWVARRAHEVGSAEVLVARHLLGSDAGLSDVVLDAVAGRELPRDALLNHIRRWLFARHVQDPYLVRALVELVWPSGAQRDGITFSGPAERYSVLRALLKATTVRDIDDGVARPLLLQIDDAQWGPDSLAFLRFLSSHADGDLPLLALVTVRDESLGDSPAATELFDRVLDLEACTEIRLGPLSQLERRDLVRHLLLLEGEVADQVVSRTDGNPLFAVQLVGDWVQRGILTAGPDGFVLRPGVVADLPDDIHALWDDRITRLLADRAPHTRSALEIAALLGPEIDPTEWRGACRVARAPTEADLVSTLMERRLAEPRGSQWAFAHGMLRESLRRSADESGRAVDHHDACATALQIRYDVARAPGLAERLGRHLVAAGRLAEAIEPLTAGAQERRDQSNYRAAMQLQDLVVSTLDASGAEPLDQRRGYAAIEQASLMASIGQHRAAHALAMETADRFSTRWPLLEAPALRTAGFAAAKQGQLDVAEALLNRATQASDRLGEVHERARAEQHLAELHRIRGDSAQARWLAERALSAFTAAGDVRGRADALVGLAGIVLATGDLEGARTHTERALGLFESCGARFGVASATNALGDILRRQGDLDQSAVAYERARALLAELGSADQLIPSLNLGFTRIALGQYDEAEAPLRAAEAIAASAGRQAMLGAVHAALLCCDAFRDDREAFEAHLRSATDALHRSGMVDSDIAAALESAAAAARQRRWDEASAFASRTAAAQRAALPKA